MRTWATDHKNRSKIKTLLLRRSIFLSHLQTLVFIIHHYKNSSLWCMTTSQNPSLDLFSHINFSLCTRLHLFVTWNLIYVSHAFTLALLSYHHCSQTLSLSFSPRHSCQSLSHSLVFLAASLLTHLSPLLSPELWPQGLRCPVCGAGYCSFGLFSQPTKLCSHWPWGPCRVCNHPA